MILSTAKLIYGHGVVVNENTGFIVGPGKENRQVTDLNSFKEVFLKTK